FCGRLDDGTPVAVLPIVACGRCERCLAGDDQQCASVLGAMYGISLDGGLADEAWVDPRCATALPPGLPLDQACLVEPIAVALHGINRAGVVSGMRVLVIGAGPIGLCTIAAARSIGASVDLVAHRPRRIDAGERLGAGTAVGTGYDIVLEAAGTPGTMSILGNFWDPMALGLGFQLKEVTLLPSFTYGHHHGVSEFEDAVRVLDATPDLAETIITHRFS